MRDLGFGQRLALARVAAGLDQGEAAAALGIRRETLSGYEQAERNGPDTPERFPRANDLRRICELYGVSSDWLLWGEEPRAKRLGERHLSALPGGRREPRAVIQSPLVL